MSADEVVAYSLGFDARVVNAASVRPYAATSKLAQEFEHRIDVLKRAVEDGELQLPTNWPAFLPLSKNRGFNFPKKLTKALEGALYRGPQALPQASAEVTGLQARIGDLERKLAEPHPRRYQSALKVLRAVAVKKYGHRPGAARSPAPQAMSDDTDNGRGKGKVSDDTIRDLLKEAEEIAFGDTPNSDSS